MSTENKSKPLDGAKIAQINKLFHEQGVTNRSLIAERLGIARRTVCKYLMSKEKWDAQKSV